MARLSRSEVFSPDEIAIVHVMNRVVRRCFLLGTDPLTGKNYDHRKQWIEQLLERQARFFGIDLLCYSILSNHFHQILRSRPDVVKTWDDTEVARRWLMICPIRKERNGEPCEPKENELNSIRNDRAKLKQIRSRLSDISWWMRLLCQKIAQRANAEDELTGKFWESRFRGVKILDEAGLLACAAYVELNPIRAAMAETLESTEHTSIRCRIDGLRIPPNAQRLADGFLAPLTIDEKHDKLGPCPHRSGKRCSDKGFLPMPLEKFLELVDWTGRQIATGKPGSIPHSTAAILERLQLEPQTWCSMVRDFGEMFYTVAGLPQEIERARSLKRKCKFRIPHPLRDLLGK